MVMDKHTLAVGARIQLIALVLLRPAEIACAGGPGATDLDPRVLRRPLGLCSGSSVH